MIWLHNRDLFPGSVERGAFCRANMHTPKTLDQVYLDGSDKVFVVTWIDHEREFADLIPIGGNGPTAEDVPWERLYPVAPAAHAPIRSELDSHLRDTSDRWRSLQKLQQPKNTAV